MCSPEARDALTSCRRVLDDAIAGSALDGIPGDDLGTVISAALRLYVAKRDAGESLPIVAGDSPLTATEIVVACQALLDAADLEPFELSMWTRLGRL